MSGVNDQPSIMFQQNTSTENTLSEDMRRKALIRLLQSWREEGDEQDQIETLKFLQQALDEDRLSDRKLFP